MSLKFAALSIVSLFSISSFAIESPSLVGTWRLVSMERQNEDGRWVARCFSPSGLITYTAQGFMAVGINCMNGENSKEPTQDPKDMIFYTGRYELQGTKVIHHIANSASLDFFEKDLERDFVFESERRVWLRGKGKGGKLVRLLWERAHLASPLVPPSASR